MPKFLYTVILLVVILWGIVYRLVNGFSPESSLIVLLFLVVLFFALALTLSIPVYVVLLKRAPRFTVLREIYRKAIRISLYISFGIILMLILRWLNLFNPITFVLFIAFYLLTFIHLRKSF